MQNTLGGTWQQESLSPAFHRYYTPELTGEVYPQGDATTFAWMLRLGIGGKYLAYSLDGTTFNQAQAECDGAARATLSRWAEEGMPKPAEFLGILIVPENVASIESARQIDSVLARRGVNVLTISTGEEVRLIPARVYVSTIEESTQYLQLISETIELAKTKLNEKSPNES